MKEKEKIKNDFKNWDLDLIFAESLDILIFIDITTLKILNINKTVYRILGYKPEELIGQKFETLFPDDNVHRDELIKTITVYGPVLECQKFKHKNGSTLPLDLTATIIDLNDRKIAFVTLRDSREKEERNQQIQYTKNHLKLINQIIRHDIINDISIIKGALKLYIETRDEKYLQAINKSVDNSIAIIKNMRKVEKQLEENENLQVVNVSNLIDKIKAKYSDVEINVSGNANVLADDTLYSVFNNLIHNAVVHGKSKKIDIKILKKTDKVEIHFIDYGIGIDETIKDKIFEKGFTMGKDIHMGLGLYIVKQSLKNYSGQIEVKPNKPTGTIFILRLQRVN